MPTLLGNVVFLFIFVLRRLAESLCVTCTLAEISIPATRQISTSGLGVGIGKENLDLYLRRQDTALSKNDEYIVQ